MVYDKVLIPTDGSQGTKKAIEHGIDIAEMYNAEVHTIYVVDMRISYHGVFQDHLLDKLETEGEEATEEVAVRAEDEGLDAFRTVETGIPHEEIVEYAEENDIDLIAMGTHGRTGIERLIIGSTTENVVRHSKIPVLTVRMTPEDLD